MNNVTIHHDGHGLNDSIFIEHDARDFEKGGGASHRYVFNVGESPISSAHINFQHGPHGEPGSVTGVTDAALLAVLIDRYRCFQAGPFACRENALALTKMEEALHWMKHRADDRAERGVLGKLEK